MAALQLAVASPARSMLSAGHETLYALCLELAPARCCDLSYIPLQDQSSLYFPSGIMTFASLLHPVACCLMLDLPATSFEASATAQKQPVNCTVTHSLIHCIMHPPARFVELLLTRDTSRVASECM